MGIGSQCLVNVGIGAVLSSTSLEGVGTKQRAQKQSGVLAGLQKRKGSAHGLGRELG